jgi:succinate dehydrogenase/fumarate reductase flavoprotein subunit
MMISQKKTGPENNRADIVVIGGLYAVGNDAGCVHGGTYTGGAGAPGCDLSFAFCSGVIAGENAARYVLAGGE